MRLYISDEGIGILQGVLEELITVEYELTGDGDTLTHSFASSSDSETGSDTDEY